MNYDAIDAVNSSTLKVLWSQSPLHYLYRLTVPRIETPAMALGTAAHMAILEARRFDGHYTIRPKGLRAGTKAGDAWLAEHAGESLISQEHFDLAIGMRDAVLANSTALWWLTRAEPQPEHVIVWTDEETGIKCKGRVDLLNADGLVGLKTCSTTDERLFSGQAARLGYHFQWAFYYDGLCALGREPKSVIEICVEQEPPHDVVPAEIDVETLDAGREAYRSALVTLAACRAKNEWPGRCSGMRRFRLPAWATPHDDDNLGGLDFTGLEAAQ
jgi:exodeoxyribonuclease VIII